AQLAGYGPIGALAALRIAADGLWRRVLADPACGAAVGVEEGAWRPSTALARLVGLRWGGSAMPSSTRPVGFDHGPAGGGGGGGGSGGGQLDHVVPYGGADDGAGGDRTGAPAGGPTEATNLQLLAQVEHLLKQAGEHARPGHGWSVAVDKTGTSSSGTSADGTSDSDTSDSDTSSGGSDTGGGGTSDSSRAGTSGSGTSVSAGRDDRGAAPEPAPGDGVVWTSPTGHTYRVSPQSLLDPDDGPPSGLGRGEHPDGELPGWVHRLLADVLPSWVGWPPDGAPAPSAAGAAGGEAVWSRDWAHAVMADTPPDPASTGPVTGPVTGDVTRTGSTDDDEPSLFDDLPAA
ncbi:hypothetical protein ACUN9U_17605, partial [Quadrisphaera sp. KR29]